ncbi:response regulator [Roseimaritima sediminicola]|uniref:response regulator n=1 Tax=Roseimaritima sediminicola TaxID=2662066 RepID=UPI00129829BF|nr:response regulator [Roseimaritima sediminicola]
MCRSILIVEDTRPISFLLSQYLRDLADQIDIAYDGHEAVRRVVRSHVDRHPYDLILMDLQMPVMSGLEATLAIRNRGISTPIIAMTAGNLDPDRCREAGCDGYLLKPIDRVGFLQYLKTFLP